MNISMAGNNTLQTGFSTVPYVTSSDGAILLDGYDDSLIKNAVDSILANTYPNMFDKRILIKRNQRSKMLKSLGKHSQVKLLLTLFLMEHLEVRMIQPNSLPELLNQSKRVKIRSI